MAAQPPRPGHSHLVDFPEALEAFTSRLGEMRLVLGPQAADGLGEVEELLRRALAARDRGDPPLAVRHLGEAMTRFAALAAEALPGEGPALRAMAEHFRRAAAAGALSDARETAEVMRERSGSVTVPKKVR